MRLSPQNIRELSSATSNLFSICTLKGSGELSAIKITEKREMKRTTLTPIVGMSLSLNIRMGPLQPRKLLKNRCPLATTSIQKANHFITADDFAKSLH
jgi:hypothetical protein